MKLSKACCAFLSYIYLLRMSPSTAYKNFDTESMPVCVFHHYCTNCMTTTMPDNVICICGEDISFIKNRASFFASLNQGSTKMSFEMQVEFLFNYVTIMFLIGEWIKRIIIDRKNNRSLY